jgi:hypothetical protein
VLLRADGPQSTDVSVRVTWHRILAVAVAVILASPVLGVVGAPLELPVFLSFYAVSTGVGSASLGTVALTLRS